MRSLALACIAGLATAYDHWAVLVAGSNTYGNYRHQSDTHHAYQIMKANGIPTSNIIHMAYDDIASSPYNPFPGQIFNKPNGPNVYFADEIDYKGKTVNKTTFEAVLKGDKATAGGKVLESTENSKVFIYFADHGGTDLICFPSGPYLYSDELQQTIDYMYNNKMYSELVFYVEACESGSMFPNLKAEQRVYAMTASNASLSSWGTYCGTDAVVDGKNIGSCLGDLFSVNWMQDTEANDPSVETLETQYENVKTATTKSPVCKFGDFDFMSEPIGDFEGVLTSPHQHSDSWEGRFKRFATHVVDKTTQKAKKFIDVIRPEQKAHNHVDSRDNKLHFLTEKAMREGTKEAHEELKAEVEHRMFADDLFTQLFPGYHTAEDFEVTDHDCLRFTVGAVEDLCGKFSDYSLKYVRSLAYACENLSADEIAAKIGQVAEICQ